MRKGEKKKEELEVPSFLDQANALIETTYKQSAKIDDPDYRPGLNIIDHKLWVSVMDLHVKHITEIQTKVFTDSIAEHYEPIMRAISSVESQQKIIVSDIKSLKDELTELSRQHFADVKEINSKLANDQREIRLIKDSILTGKKRVDELELELEKIKPEVIDHFIERIDEISPCLDTILRDQERILEGEKTRNVVKKYAIGIAISALITWFTITIVFNIHNRNTIEQLERFIEKMEIKK